MNGIVTEQDMDEAGIMNIDSDLKTPKDQRVLHQQRAVLMNSAECIAKYKLYRTEKETNTARTAEKRTDRTKYNFHKARYQLWYLELSTSAKTQENKKRKVQGIPGRVNSWVEERDEVEMTVPNL
jgi:hypothetical protein